MSFLIQLLLLLNIILLSFCEPDETLSMKVFACLNLIDRKYKEGEAKPTIHSPIMLSCYARIDDEQIQRVLTDFEKGEGENSFEKDEIDDLLNMDNLKHIPQEELVQKSDELQKIIKQFNNFDEDFAKIKENQNIDPEIRDKLQNNDDLNFDDIDEEKLSYKIKEFIRNIFGTNTIWLVIFIMIILYLLFILIKATSDLEKDKKS